MRYFGMFFLIFVSFCVFGLLCLIINVELLIFLESIVK